MIPFRVVKSTFFYVEICLALYFRQNVGGTLISTKICIKSCIKKVVDLLCSTLANFKIKGNSLKFSNNY